MEERGSKTIMCSVFFLDIVGYSKMSVTGQISLKERFNRYLSAAIEDVPIADRIILDTGDGAAINFLGDIEEALKAALALREKLLSEDPDIAHPLLVRMGINLGPVRLIRDINGQPNIVGDGINVAQRVMGFADASQILVSRSYYDAVSRISPQYAGMFHYQGSRTDKHVREHEVYAIGYPGDKTTIGRAARLFFERSEGPLGKAYERATLLWRSLVARADYLFRRAEPMQRALYIGAGAIPLLLIILLVYLKGHDDIPAKSAEIDQLAAVAIQPGSGVAGLSSQPDLTVVQGSSVEETADARTDEVAKSGGGSGPANGIIAESKQIDEAKAAAKTKSETGTQKVLPKKEEHDAVERKSEFKVSTGGSGAYLAVKCLAGSEVFLDGTKKGRISDSTVTIQAAPGPHTVIVSHPSGVDSRNIVFEAGKTVHINPNFCD
ncbi:MAG: adenylate/guanylate cyclase domain-containing protein [Pseudomonadota bacterium]